MRRRVAVPLLTLFCTVIFAAPFVLGQSVEGISEIAYDVPNGQIDTYSATELDYYASLYYDAYVEGYLFQSDDWNNPIKAGAALNNPVADGYMQAPAMSGDQYVLQSDHYVVAYFVVGYDNYGSPIYGDYYGFSFLSTAGSGGSDGDQYAPPNIYTEVVAEYIYLGSTVVGISTFDQTPVITSISPSVIPDGVTTTVTITGLYFGTAPQLQVEDAPSTTVVVTYGSDNQLTAQITPNGDEGVHNIEVISNGYGGTGFLSSPGTSKTSQPHSLTVAGHPCTIQISTPQKLYHITSSSPDGNGNYQTATIPVTLKTTPSATCNGASSVTWSVHASYATSAGKGASPQDDPPGFTTALNETRNYVTPAGVGGQVTFAARFTTSDNKSHSTSKTVYVDGTSIPLDQVKNLMIQDYSYPGGNSQAISRNCLQGE